MSVETSSHAVAAVLSEPAAVTTDPLPAAAAAPSTPFADLSHVDKIKFMASHRYSLRLRMLIKFGLAVYTAYALWSAYVRLQRTNVTLQMKPPSDQCVPYFDVVSAFVDRNPGQVMAAYDYVSSVALVRVCSNFSSDATTDAIGGTSFRYDPMSAMGCSLATAVNYAYVEANCDHSAVSENCSQILSTSPTPNGYDWKYGVLKVGTNPCDVKFTYLQNPLAACTLSYVGSYRSEYPIGTSIVYASIIIPIVVVGTQLIAMIASIWAIRFTLWAWVMEGMLAPFLYAFHVAQNGRRAPFPNVSHHIVTWGVLFLTVGAEGLITPSIYLHYCGLDRFPTQLALFILKIIQLSFILLSFWIPLIYRWRASASQETRERSPEDEFQGVVYRTSDATTKEEIQKERSYRTNDSTTKPLSVTLPAVLRGFPADAWRTDDNEPDLLHNVVAGVWYDPNTGLVRDSNGNWTEPNSVVVTSLSGVMDPSNGP